MDARVTAGSQLWGSAAVRVLDYPTEPATMEELQALLGAIEALLMQINAAEDSELGRLRSSGRQALAAAQAAIAPRVGRVRSRSLALWWQASSRAWHEA